jgi:hypothetical protein
MLHLHLILIFSQLILLGKGSHLPGSHYFVKKKLNGFSPSGSHTSENWWSGFLSGYHSM